MLNRQIHLLENDLATAKELLATEQLSLHTRIIAKDTFYKHTRIRRVMDAPSNPEDKDN
jgi:hypothetical protein